jgi:hypothetical protein
LHKWIAVAVVVAAAVAFEKLEEEAKEEMVACGLVFLLNLYKDYNKKSLKRSTLRSLRLINTHPAHTERVG